MILLSILIPSIPQRAEKLSKLMFKLNLQKMGMFNDLLLSHYVEVIVDNSPSFLEGGLTIGAKRNELKNKATGKYLCFIDDDDDIAPNYLESLVRACYLGRDVVTFKSLVKLENAWGIVKMSLNTVHNSEFTPVGLVRRPPWHICPVKTKFAQEQDFIFVNNAEDFNWMERVLKSCFTESHLDMILYEYNHGEHSEADKIQRTKHE